MLSSTMALVSSFTMKGDMVQHQSPSRKAAGSTNGSSARQVEVLPTPIVPFTMIRRFKSDPLPGWIQNTPRCLRGSIRKQSRKTLTAKRHLPCYRALCSIQEHFDPLPCICRLAAVFRCFAVLAEPLFSYVARALCGACRIKRLAYLPSMTSRVSRAIISSSLVSMTKVRTRAPQAVISTTSDFCL